MKRLAGWAALVAAVFATACGEGLLRETAPLPPAQLGIVASFSSAAGGAEQAFGRTNRVHVRFTSDGQVRSEQTLPFDPAGAEMRVPVDVVLRSTSESFMLDLELLRDGDAVFSASAPVTLTAGAATAVEVVLQPVLARVVCAGPPVVLDAIGATQQLGAAALFATDDTIFGMPIQWSSGSAAVATVTPAGVVRAVTEGETSVQCSAGERTDARVVRVQAAVATVVVTPAQVGVDRGATQALTAVVRDRLGNLLVGRTIAWSSTAPAVASVSATGVVTGVAAGTARIDAATGGVTGSATVTVRNRVPGVTTGTATVTPTAATLAGTVLPYGLAGEAWFEFDTSPTFQRPATTPPTPFAAGTAPFNAGAVLNQISRGVTYYYRAAARNSVGEARGAILSFQLPIVVSLVPASARMGPGAGIRFSATVDGAPSAAVTWESSNPAVATVDQQGYATAHAIGSATITATVVGNPQSRATATVTVDNTASLTFESVRSESGGLVNPSAVAGEIAIRLHTSATTAHGVRAVAILAGSTEVCREAFPQPLNGQAMVDCRVNTAAADDQGVPRFRNGAYVLRAVALSATGAEIAQTDFCAQGSLCQLTFANTSTARVTVAGTGPSAADAQGQTWWQAFTARVTPIIYGAGDDPAAIRVEAVHGTTVVPRAVPSVTGPGSHLVTFPAAQLAGVEGAVQVRAEVTTRSGAVFTSPDPAGQPEMTVRIDNRAPVLTSLAGPRHETFVGSRFEFSAITTDSGIGAGTTSFDVVPAGAPSGAPVTGGSNVSGTERVPESPTSSAYALRVTTADALNNRTAFYLLANGQWSAAPGAGIGRFGVEHTAPVLTVASGPDDGSANYQSGGWLLSFADPTGPSGSASGINADSLMARLVRFSAQYPGGACVDPRTESRDLLSTNVQSSACYVALDPSQAYVSAPLWSNEDQDEGYFRMSAFVVDNAGNRSEPLVRTTLYDGTPADIGTITAPGVLVGGQAATFTATITDNVDLGEVVSVLGFHGDTAAWLALGTSRPSGYGPPLVTSTTVSANASPFIRSITQVMEGYITDRWATATWIEFVVRDEASFQRGDSCLYWWDCVRAQQEISGAVAAGVGGTPFRNWTQLASQDQNVAFIMEHPEVSTNGQSAVLRVHMRGSAGIFQTPLDRVEFYLRPSGSAGFRAEPLGVGSVTSTEVGVYRVYTYTIGVGAAGVPSGGYEVFALGVDGNGDALISDAVPLDVEDERFYSFNYSPVVGVQATPQRQRPPLTPSRSSRQ